MSRLFPGCLCGGRSPSAFHPSGRWPSPSQSRGRKLRFYDRRSNWRREYRAHSGDFGKKDDARVLDAGKTILASGSASLAKATTANILALSASQNGKDVGIGVKPSANIAYVPATPANIKLIVTYKA
ncbi:hypothetical protein FNJ84_17665 [Paracoccus sp. M683]|uniref:hypothetical protein n=1 Tax=Paracoccus sp. M683 TaxID=2594268 RepID=UPI00118104F5|nr:hypothetical protein [Paracoccus sp. M683]TRW94920.1 hypothetical protein FNJ84_17665 [Paracoccus sp. M683]